MVAGASAPIGIAATRLCSADLPNRRTRLPIRRADQQLLAAEVKNRAAPDLIAAAELPVGLRDPTVRRVELSLRPRELSLRLVDHVIRPAKLSLRLVDYLIRCADQSVGIAEQLIRFADLSNRLDEPSLRSAEHDIRLDELMIRPAEHNIRLAELMIALAEQVIGLVELMIAFVEQHIRVAECPVLDSSVQKSGHYTRTRHTCRITNAPVDTTCNRSQRQHRRGIHPYQQFAMVSHRDVGTPLALPCSIGRPHVTSPDLLAHSNHRSNHPSPSWLIRREFCMQAPIRRKLSMARRALDFALANAIADAGYTTVVTRLQASVARGDTLIIQERSGRVSEIAAVARRLVLRRNIRGQALLRLVRIAAIAAKDHPEFAKQFPMPRRTGPNKTFVTDARAMLAAAQAQSGVFTALGVGATFFDDLTKALADYDSATVTVHAGRGDHIGARADLETVAKSCIADVAVLGTFIETTFRTNADLMASWKSASNVAGPFKRSAAPVDPTTPVVPVPVTPVEPAVPTAPESSPIDGGQAAAM